MDYNYGDNSPLISVIVPVYNAEKFLVECIDSIVKQTYKKLEIILVDDGSTDSSGNICDDYANIDDRILVIHKENEGLSAARKTGADKMSGRYVMFVDSDDWLELNTIHECVDAVMHHSVECVLFPYYREYPHGSYPTELYSESRLFSEVNVEKLYRRLFGLINEELKNPEKIDSLVTCWGKLYSESLVKKGQFIHTKLIGTEDLYYNIHALHNVERVFYINKPLYHYRKNVENSLTHTYRNMLQTQWKKLFSMIAETIKEFNLNEEYYNALHNRIALSILGIGLNELNNPEGAITKIKAINTYINSSQYRKSVKRINISELPLKWKVLIFCAKYRLVLVLYVLLCIGKELKKRG